MNTGELSAIFYAGDDSKMRVSPAQLQCGCMSSHICMQ